MVGVAGLREATLGTAAVVSHPPTPKHTPGPSTSTLKSHSCGWWAELLVGLERLLLTVTSSQLLSSLPRGLSQASFHPEIVQKIIRKQKEQRIKLEEGGVINFRNRIKWC